MCNPIHHGHAVFRDNRGNGTMLPAWYAAMWHAGEWGAILPEHDPAKSASLANYRAIAQTILDVKHERDSTPEEEYGWATGVDYVLNTMGAYNGMPHDYATMWRRLEWFAEAYGF